jgi:hypothetical protein
MLDWPARLAWRPGALACLVPRLLPIRVSGPFRAALHRSHVRAVNHRPGPVQRPAACSSASSGSCSCCQTRPGASPAAVASRSSPSRTPAHAAGTPPRDPGAQHEQDAVQHLAVIQPPAAGMTSPPQDDRQQRLNPSLQLVRDDPWWLLPLPHSQAQPSHEHRYSHTPLCWEFSARTAQLCRRRSLRLGCQQELSPPCTEASARIRHPVAAAFRLHRKMV